LCLSPGTVVSATVVSAISEQVNGVIDSGERDVAATSENSYTSFIGKQKQEERDQLPGIFLRRARENIFSYFLHCISAKETRAFMEEKKTYEEHSVI